MLGRMNKIFISLLLLLPVAVFAGVYKWMDDAGNIHYGDAPPEDIAATRVELPETSTYQPPATTVRTNKPPHPDKDKVMLPTPATGPSAQ